MQGPKIEDIRDPKWLNKEILVAAFGDNEPHWLRYAGNYYIVVEDKRGQEYNLVADNSLFYEWRSKPKRWQPEKKPGHTYGFYYINSTGGVGFVNEQYFFHYENLWRYLSKALLGTYKTKEEAEKMLVKVKEFVNKEIGE